jgi:hypothetical protein
MTLDHLRGELDGAIADLRAHMASWEYAYAMGARSHGASEHPVHWETRERTRRLEERCRDLRARLAELELD